MFRPAADHSLNAGLLQFRGQSLDDALDITFPIRPFLIELRGQLLVNLGFKLTQ
jgi:hypothetical protein